MKLVKEVLGGVKLFHTQTFSDDRGQFTEYFNCELIDFLKEDAFEFVLEYASVSKKNVLRGLHYQVGSAQGKLITVLSGAACDVVLDLRVNSPTFGKHSMFSLSAQGKELIWIPPGFAHGFLSLENDTVMYYKCTGKYSPIDERCIKWNDVDLAINWPINSQKEFIVSKKDRAGNDFKHSQYFE